MSSVSYIHLTSAIASLLAMRQSTTPAMQAFAIILEKVQRSLLYFGYAVRTGSAVENMIKYVRLTWPLDFIQQGIRLSQKMLTPRQFALAQSMLMASGTAFKYIESTLQTDLVRKVKAKAIGFSQKLYNLIPPKLRPPPPKLSWIQPLVVGGSVMYNFWGYAKLRASLAMQKAIVLCTQKQYVKAKELLETEGQTYWTPRIDSWACDRKAVNTFASCIDVFEAISKYKKRNGTNLQQLCKSIDVAMQILTNEYKEAYNFLLCQKLLAAFKKQDQKWMEDIFPKEQTDVHIFGESLYLFIEHADTQKTLDHLEKVRGCFPESYNEAITKYCAFEKKSKNGTSSIEDIDGIISLIASREELKTLCAALQWRKIFIYFYERKYV